MFPLFVKLLLVLQVHLVCNSYMRITLRLTCDTTRHGPLSACPISHTEQLVQEYLAAEENSAERTLIEKRYGRSLVIRLITAYEEDKATKQWISSSTMTCPGCDSSVEKSEGCNHVSYHAEFHLLF